MPIHRPTNQHFINHLCPLTPMQHIQSNVSIIPYLIYPGSSASCLHHQYPRETAFPSFPTHNPPPSPLIHLFFLLRCLTKSGVNPPGVRFLSRFLPSCTSICASVSTIPTKPLSIPPPAVDISSSRSSQSLLTSNGVCSASAPRSGNGNSVSIFAPV